MNPRQKFLEHALAVGLDCGMITPADVIKHCNPDVLAHNLPPGLKAKLIEACLAAPKMDAELIVKTLGTQNLAENMPMHVVWACIAECAARALGDASAASAGAAKPTAKPAKKAADVTKPADKPTTTSPSSSKAKAPTKPPPPGKNGPAAVASKAAAKKPEKARSLANGTNKTRVPKNEFDVDTDVGEDVVSEDVGWDDDIVEVVEEDVIGASTSVLDEIASNGGVSDWSREEETVTRDVNKRS